MDSQASLTPFELELKAILDMPEPNPAFVQKLHVVLARMPKRAQPFQHRNSLRWGTRRPAWVWAVIALLLVVFTLTVAIGPERVLAAARQWLGSFIPSVGFVDDSSSLRVLEAPVQISTDGASIAVEKAYTNAEETDVQIHYLQDSRTCKNTDVTYQEYRARLNEQVYLLLPDGRKLYALTPHFSNWGRFPALPKEVSEVVLMVPPDVIVPCAQEGGDGNPTSTFCQCMDEDLRWLIQLKFVAPPPGSVMPVIDSATPTPEPAAPPSTTAAQPENSTVAPASVDQPELVGKMVALDDGYLFLVALKRAPDGSLAYSFGMNERHFNLFDANGQEVAVEEIDRSQVNPSVFDGFDYGDALLLRAQAGQLAGPLTLTFPSLVKSQYQFDSAPEFTVDLGANPQVGQRLPFQTGVDLIPDHPLSLRAVGIDSPNGPDGLGVSLYFQGQGVETIQVNSVPLPDNPPMGGSSGQCADFPDCFYTSTSITPAADGLYHLAVTGADYTVAGPWSLTFNLDQPSQ